MTTTDKSGPIPDGCLLLNKRQVLTLLGVSYRTLDWNPNEGIDNGNGTIHGRGRAQAARRGA